MNIIEVLILPFSYPSFIPDKRISSEEYWEGGSDECLTNLSTGRTERIDFASYGYEPLSIPGRINHISCSSEGEKKCFTFRSAEGEKNALLIIDRILHTVKIIKGEVFNGGICHFSPDSHFLVWGSDRYSERESVVMIISIDTGETKKISTGNYDHFTCRADLERDGQEENVFIRSLGSPDLSKRDTCLYYIERFHSYRKSAGLSPYCRQPG